MTMSGWHRRATRCSLALLLLGPLGAGACGSDSTEPAPATKTDTGMGGPLPARLDRRFFSKRAAG